MKHYETIDGTKVKGETAEQVIRELHQCDWNLEQTLAQYKVELSRRAMRWAGDFIRCRPFEALLADLIKAKIIREL